MNRLRSASIRTQILVLAFMLIALVSIVAATSEPFIKGRHDKGVAIGLLAGRVERVIDDYRRAADEPARAGILREAVARGIDVRPVSAAEAGDAAIDVSGGDVAVLDAVRERLELRFGAEVRQVFQPEPRVRPLVATVGTGGLLQFDLPVFRQSEWFYPAVVSGLLKIVLPLTVLAIASAWLISRPISRFAEAAERASVDDSLETPFAVEGARELRSLAASLDVMRGRILQMAESRTRMLSSISHDLRTPLTRLRLRVEKCGPPDLQHKMLQDIGMLDSMISESMAFLTNAMHNVPSRRVDLSSLLQTVATDFNEAGHDIRFVGPRRFKYVCKPESLTRAVSNLVSNATRHATRVAVELEDGGGRGVFIRVQDNGPGLDDDLKRRVLEPFFRADAARGMDTGGFGLGLPTAEGLVRKGHGGSLTLLDRKPHGLIAEIRLPPVRDAGDGHLPGDRLSVPRGAPIEVPPS